MKRPRHILPFARPEAAPPEPMMWINCSLQPSLERRLISIACYAREVADRVKLGPGQVSHVADDGALFVVECKPPKLRVARG